MVEAFHTTYERDYGYRDEASGVEAVDWCLAATFPDTTAEEFEMKAVMHKQSAGVDGTRQIYFPEAGERVACRILDRGTLAAAGELDGPAIVEDPESTILALPGDRLSMSERGDVIIDINVKGRG